MISLPHSVRASLLDQFWRDGKFRCENVVSQKIFLYIKDKDFFRRPCKKNELNINMDVYMFAAAHRWMEPLPALRSKIMSGMDDDALEKLRVVSQSALKIKDMEMYEFYWKQMVEKKGYPEELCQI